MNQAEALLYLPDLDSSVLFEGSYGIHTAIETVETLLSTFSSSTPSHLIREQFEVKGREKLFVGIHPITDKFFVAESLDKPQYTTTEIFENYKEDSRKRNILLAAYRALTENIYSNVVEGEVLYIKEDLDTVQENSIPYIAFFNERTIVVPFDSPLGEKILESDIGVVFHTRYVGKSQRKEKLTTTLESVDSSLVSFPRLVFNVTGKTNLTAEGEDSIDRELEKALEAAASLSPRFLETLNGSDLSMSLYEYEKNCERDRVVETAQSCLVHLSEHDSSKDVLAFLEGRTSASPVSQLSSLVKYRRAMKVIRTILESKIRSLREISDPFVVSSITPRVIRFGLHPHIEEIIQTIASTKVKLNERISSPLKTELGVARTINSFFKGSGLKAYRQKVGSGQAGSRHSDVLLTYKGKRAWVEVKMSHSDQFGNPRFYYDHEWKTSYKGVAPKIVEALNESEEAARFIKDISEFSGIEDPVIADRAVMLRDPRAVSLKTMTKFFRDRPQYIMTLEDVDLGKAIQLHYAAKAEPVSYLQTGDDFFLIGEDVLGLNEVNLPYIPVLQERGSIRVRIGVRSEGYYEPQAEIKLFRLSQRSPYSIFAEPSAKTSKKNPFTYLIEEYK